MIELSVHPKSDWDGVAESTHLEVFEEVRPADANRFDFAILARTQGSPFGYVTCRETDDSTLYISYGGIFPEKRKSVMSYRVLDSIIDMVFREYDHIDTMVENSNYEMLKLYFKKGFLVVGTANLKDSIYLLLRKEKNNEV